MPATLVEINLEIICLYMTDMYRNAHTHTKKQSQFHLGISQGSWAVTSKFKK